MSENRQIVKFSDGREVCQSYGVSVAAFIPGKGYVKTARKYSVTTSRHANSYAGDRATILEDAAFRALIPELER